MRKETIVEVPKAWGKEVILVNNDLYCGELLYLDMGTESSLHHHVTKMETFYCLKGQVALHINGRDYLLNPSSRPKTIEPREKHSFRGVTEAVILEVSTHHDDADVVRYSESKPGRPDTEEGK